MPENVLAAKRLSVPGPAIVSESLLAGPSESRPLKVVLPELATVSTEVWLPLFVIVPPPNVPSESEATVWLLPSRSNVVPLLTISAVVEGTRCCRRCRDRATGLLRGESGAIDAYVAHFAVEERRAVVPRRPAQPDHRAGIERGELGLRLRIDGAVDVDRPRAGVVRDGHEVPWAVGHVGRAGHPSAAIADRAHGRAAAIVAVLQIERGKTGGPGGTVALVQDR